MKKGSLKCLHMMWFQLYIFLEKLKLQRQECFPGGASSKEPTYQGRRHRESDLIPGLGRSPGEGNGNPLQYSCLENPREDREAWQATVHRITKNWTGWEWLSTLSDQWLPQDWGMGERHEYVKCSGLIGQWNCLGYCNGGYMTLCICQSH